MNKKMVSEAQVKRLGVVEVGGFRPRLCFLSLFYFPPFLATGMSIKTHWRNSTYRFKDIGYGSLGMTQEYHL